MNAAWAGQVRRSVRHAACGALMVAATASASSAPAVSAGSRASEGATPALPPPPSPELLLSAGPRALSTSPMHPPVVLRDEAGAPVMRSLGAVDPMKTCGGCHDADYIATHNDHANLGLDERVPSGNAPSGRPWDFGPGLYGRWDPIAYDVVRDPDRTGLDSGTIGTADWVRRNAWRIVGGGPAAAAPDRGAPAFRGDESTPWDWRRSGVVATNCFLCHVRGAANRERIEEVAAGRFRWAATATLAALEIVERDADGWRWRSDRFLPDGALPSAVLAIQPPTNRECGFCHGLVHRGDSALSLLPRQPGHDMTETQGLVYAAQRIRDSAVNVEGKEDLARPWDVHAERLLRCASCHFTLNHPAFAEPDRSNRPAHLQFEARRADMGQYLFRPDHRFAKGNSTQRTAGNRTDGTMRTCEACHDPAAPHQWLPRWEQHLAKMECEVCHIPYVHTPAREETDWTMLRRPGEARVAYRGTQGAIDDPLAFVIGYRPVLLGRRTVRGPTKLAPYNLITTWFWVTDEPQGQRPVPRDRLTAAFFAGDRHHPELVRVLDANGDGRLDDGELRLDTQAKVDAARTRLEAVGVVRPHMASEIDAYGLYHGVAPGKYATRTCATCHAEGSRMTESLALSDRAPWGPEPQFVADAELVRSGEVVRGPQGAIVFRPRTESLGLHVLGHSRSRFADWGGLLAVVGTMLGVAIHVGARWRARRNGSRS